MTINTANILSFVLVSLLINVSYILAMLFLLTKAYKQKIEEVALGSYQFFSFHIRDLKISIGATFLLDGSIKPAEYPDKTLNQRYKILSAGVKILQLAGVLYYSKLSLSVIDYYLQYFSFGIGFKHLTLMLPAFNGYSLALGLLLLSIIFEIINILTSWLIRSEKIVETVLVTSAFIVIFLYLRFVYGYLFTDYLSPLNYS